MKKDKKIKLLKNKLSFVKKNGDFNWKLYKQESVICQSMSELLEKRNGQIINLQEKCSDLVEDLHKSIDLNGELKEVVLNLNGLSEKLMGKYKAEAFENMELRQRLDDIFNAAAGPMTCRDFHATLNNIKGKIKNKK